MIGIIGILVGTVAFCVGFRQVSGSGSIFEGCTGVAGGVDCGNVTVGIVGVGGAGLLTKRNIVIPDGINIAVISRNHRDALNRLALIVFLRRNDTGGILPAIVIAVERHIEILFCRIRIGAFGNQSEELLLRVVFCCAIGQLCRIISRCRCPGPAGKQIGIGCRPIYGNRLTGSAHGIGISSCLDHAGMRAGSGGSMEVSNRPFLASAVKASVLQQIRIGRNRAGFQLEVVIINRAICILLQHHATISIGGGYGIGNEHAFPSIVDFRIGRVAELVAAGKNLAIFVCKGCVYAASGITAKQPCCVNVSREGIGAR